MKLKIISLLFGLGTIGLIAALPVQHQDKGIWGTGCDFVLDYLNNGNWFMGGYGAADLKPHNEEFVRNIARELNLKKPDKIYIKRLSQAAVRSGLYSLLFTFKDQAAVAVHWVGFARCIFVDEDQFEKLSLEAKRFVIGRELIRIKHDHAVKWWIGTSLTGFTGGILTPFAGPYISRWLDRNADLDAAHRLDVAKGALAYYAMMSNYKKKCKEDLPQWQLAVIYRKIMKFFYSPFTLRHQFNKKKRYMQHAANGDL